MTSDIRTASEPPRSVETGGLVTMQTRLIRQPAQGLSGLLLLVIPVAVILAFAVNGAQGSTIVLGPPAVFALAPTAMIAFWWENWPGTRLRASWSGWADTLLIAAIAVALTIIGQLLVGHFDLHGIFSPNPGPGHSPTFPITLPLGGAAFVAIMQVTFVCERWPFQRLGSILGGLLALATAWAAALVLGLLFDGWLPGSPKPSWSRPITVALDLVLAAILYAAVDAYAHHLHWTTAHPTEWVAHVMLNA
ncbi:MAG TPA: hypothetical protein VE200_13980, partial [Xanthobacteraceae bacterium]|nr:hypothetical protein [Xanthobacteraceae bacterium]